MKSFLIFIFCTLLLQKSVYENNIFTRGNHINRLKKEASFAFWKKNYVPAKEKYLQLISSFKLKDHAISLNLGHCYFELGDTSNARKTYELLKNSPNFKIKSIAFQQLGLLAFAINNKEKSMELTRLSLQSNPLNDGARYNYEVLKKFNISERKDESPSTDKENGPKNKKPDNAENEKKPAGKKEMKKPKNIGLSEEKANMILDAIQGEEEEAMHKKKKSNQKPEKGKPDW